MGVPPGSFASWWVLDFIFIQMNLKNCWKAFSSRSLSCFWTICFSYSFTGEIVLMNDSDVVGFLVVRIWFHMDWCCPRIWNSCTLEDYYLQPLLSSQIFWAQTGFGPNFMALLTAEFYACNHHSSLTGQAQNFCASFVSEECLALWSTHALKQKLPANLWNTLDVSKEFPASLSVDFLL